MFGLIFIGEISFYNQIVSKRMFRLLFVLFTNYLITFHFEFL